MSRYIETISLLDGSFERLDFHQERFERTRRELLGLSRHPLLVRVLAERELPEGHCKCRILYREEVEKIEFAPHRAPLIASLKLVLDDQVEYPFKAEDRSRLSELYAMREDCDDILIIRRGLVTDSYFANVIFRRGNSWFTPDNPLLAGTMRASLLQQGLIKERAIRVEDVPDYEAVSLINALNPPGAIAEIPVEKIR